MVLQSGKTNWVQPEITWMLTPQTVLEFDLNAVDRAYIENPYPTLRSSRVIGTLPPVAIAVVSSWSSFTVSLSKLCSKLLMGVSGVLISEPARYSAGSCIVSLNSFSKPPLFLALILRNAAWYFSSCVPGWASIHSSSSPSSACSSWYRFSSCSRLSRPLLNLVSILSIPCSLASWVRTPPYFKSHRCH